MNAVKAREISNIHRPKLITECVLEYVRLIAIQVESAAKKGHYSVGVRFTLPWNIQDEIIPLITLHFQKLGFQVEHRQLTETDLFEISWK